MRLAPKITRIKKIQQGEKNEGKWKETRQRQKIQWLIMLNRLPEEKSNYISKFQKNIRQKQR